MDTFEENYVFILAEYAAVIIAKNSALLITVHTNLRQIMKERQMRYSRMI